VRAILILRRAERETVSAGGGVHSVQDTWAAQWDLRGCSKESGPFASTRNAVRAGRSGAAAMLRSRCETCHLGWGFVDAEPDARTRLPATSPPSPRMLFQGRISLVD
jgi:hypothetical protein